MWMWNSISRGSPVSEDSWKLDTGAPMFCHNNLCAVKIAHQQTDKNTHYRPQQHTFLPATKICVTNRGKKTTDISIIFHEYIHWDIVLLNGTTLYTQICHTGSKNRLQTRHTTEYVGFWLQVHRYFSLFMRNISQVRRFDKPPCHWSLLLWNLTRD